MQASAADGRKNLVAGHEGLGDLKAARAAARGLLDAAPSFTVAGFGRMALFRPPLMAGLAASLRKAGLPEA